MSHMWKMIYKGWNYIVSFSTPVFGVYAIYDIQQIVFNKERRERYSRKYQESRLSEPALMISNIENPTSDKNGNVKMPRDEPQSRGEKNQQNFKSLTTSEKVNETDQTQEENTSLKNPLHEGKPIIKKSIDISQRRGDEQQEKVIIRIRTDSENEPPQKLEEESLTENQKYKKNSATYNAFRRFNSVNAVYFCTDQHQDIVCDDQHQVIVCDDSITTDQESRSTDDQHQVVDCDDQHPILRSLDSWYRKYSFEASKTNDEESEGTQDQHQDIVCDDQHQVVVCEDSKTNDQESEGTKDSITTDQVSSCTDDQHQVIVLDHQHEVIVCDDSKHNDQESEGTKDQHQVIVCDDSKTNDQESNVALLSTLKVDEDMILVVMRAYQMMKKNQSNYMCHPVLPLGVGVDEDLQKSALVVGLNKYRRRMIFEFGVRVYDYLHNTERQFGDSSVEYLHHSVIALGVRACQDLHHSVIALGVRACQDSRKTALILGVKMNNDVIELLRRFRSAGVNFDLKPTILSLGRKFHDDLNQSVFHLGCSLSNFLHKPELPLAIRVDDDLQHSLQAFGSSVFDYRCKTDQSLGVRVDHRLLQSVQAIGDRVCDYLRLLVESLGSDANLRQLTQSLREDDDLRHAVLALGVGMYDDSHKQILVLAVKVDNDAHRYGNDCKL